MNRRVENDRMRSALDPLSGGYAALLEERRGRRFHGLRGGLLGLSALAILGGLIFAHAQLSPSPIWTVRAIEVTGNRSLGRDALLKRLGLRPGLPLWAVSSRAATLLARSTPRLESVRISWRWPRDLVVSVRERESVVRVLTDPPCELAADGVVLESEDALDPADLPLLTGSFSVVRPGQKLDLPASGWDELLAIGQKAPGLWKDVSEIHYAGGRDFQLILRQGRRVILWEAGVNQELKPRLPSILAELNDGRINDAVIDLRFRDQVVVRLPEGALGDSAAAPSRTDGPNTSGPKSRANGRRAA